MHSSLIVCLPITLFMQGKLHLGCVPRMHASLVACPCNWSSAHAARSVHFLPMVRGRLRLDAYLAAKLPAASRARLQASIKEGLVVVNGRQQVRSSCAAAAPPRQLCK